MIRIAAVLTIATALLASTASAQSRVIKGAYVGCVTKDALDEFITAAVNKDERQANTLLNRVCFNINGREFSIIDRGFLQSKIRVYAGGDSVALWTVTEATR